MACVEEINYLDYWLKCEVPEVLRLNVEDLEKIGNDAQTVLIFSELLDSGFFNFFNNVS